MGKGLGVGGGYGDTVSEVRGSSELWGHRRGGTARTWPHHYFDYRNESRLSFVPKSLLYGLPDMSKSMQSWPSVLMAFFSAFSFIAVTCDLPY